MQLPSQQPPSNTFPANDKENTISITLRSLKSPPLNLQLPSQSRTTSIFELKQRVAKEIGSESTEGIKVLYARKPCSDSKTVGEVVGDEAGKEVEFGVMVVGGGVSAAVTAGAGSASVGGEDVKMGGVAKEGKGEVPAAQGQSGEEVLGSAEFWDDLKGWLMQRVRDERKADEVWSLFKRGWDER
ncbi:MAG: hypothetical protein Q9226_006663 [Calogaya cf. arnoldii]